MKRPLSGTCVQTLYLHSNKLVIKNFFFWFLRFQIKSGYVWKGPKQALQNKVSYLGLSLVFVLATSEQFPPPKKTEAEHVT